jgi:hypothetical protein
MEDDPIDERWLAELRPAVRLRYFVGQLLTADDLQKEQSYFRHKNQLHNRFEVGHGVVCGLRVTAVATTQGNGLRVSAGLALDAWGREILFPSDVDIVPLRLSDDCAAPSEGDEPLVGSAHVSVCYRELEREPHPAGAVELEARAERGAGKSLIESYCLRVRAGTAPEVSTRADAEVLDHLRSGRLHDALCVLAATTCPLASADPCVVLANIAVGVDGSLTVDACGPRAIVPTNRLLMQLAHSFTR